MSGADDLFSPEAPPPVAPPNRLHRISWLLAVALPLNLLGICCCTGVVGAVMALVGWQLADEEVARVESGALPSEARPRAQRLRTFAFGQLVFSVLSLSVQASLFGLGFYEGLLGFVFQLLGTGTPPV